MLDKIQNELHRLGYRSLKLVSESKSKCAYVFIAERQGTNCIVKFWTDDTPEIVKHGFASEFEWYKYFDNSEICPRILDKSDFYFSLDYIGRDTIWTASKNGQHAAPDELSRILLGLHLTPLATNVQAISTQECQELLLERLKDLFVSGPKGQGKLNLISRITNRVILGLAFPVLSIRIKRLLQQELFRFVNISDFYHGDLHMNNLVLSEDFARVYVIDFECARRSIPGFLADFVYMVSTYHGATNRGAELSSEIMNKLAFSEPERDGALRLLSLYYSALTLNPRFCLHANKRETKLKSAWKFLSKALSL